MLLASYVICTCRDFSLHSHITLCPLLRFRVAQTCVRLIASTGAVHLILIYVYTSVNVATQE
jgi:hypothetical protein